MVAIENLRRLLCRPAVALLIVLVVHALPRLLLGRDSFVLIHDNLDSDFLFQVLLAKPGRLLDHAADIPELLGGLPRSAFGYGLKLQTVLFAALPPFWAYVVVDLLVRVLAFSGMLRLLRDHWRAPLPRGHDVWIAAIFASLPFYPVHGASVMGQTWVAWALLNLDRRQQVRSSMAALALFPFVSSLPIAGTFVVILAGLCVVAVTIARRRIPWLPLGGIAILVAGYILSDHGFLLAMALESYVSHRSVWRLPGDDYMVVGPLTALQTLGRLFVFGQFHAPSLHTPILVVLGLSIAAALRRREQRTWWFVGAMAAALALGVPTALAKTELMRPLWDAVPASRMVNPRFYWSAAPLWFFVLAACIGYWTRRLHRAWPSTVMLAWMSIWVVAAPVEADSELAVNYQLVWSRLRGKPTNVVTYESFVSQELFSRIADHIGRPQRDYRVVSLGLHPSVAALNGFWTADGYHNNYPLAYKLRFRRLIAEELARDRGNRPYFDEWGSRAYVLLAGEPFTMRNRRQSHQRLVRERVRWSRDNLRALGVEYVLSAYFIEEPGFLDLEGVFTDERSAWRVHLYRVGTGEGSGTGV